MRIGAMLAEIWAASLVRDWPQAGGHTGIIDSATDQAMPYTCHGMARQHFSSDTHSSTELILIAHL
jgi:hypothetical protein